MAFTTLDQTMTLSVFILLWFFMGALAFQVKHFVCDYPLQNGYMLQKFKAVGWVLPLATHAGVHAVGTGILGICLGVSFKFILPAMLLDLVVHFIVDRIKASGKLLGRYRALAASEFPQVMKDALGGPKEKQIWAQRRLKENTYFWWALGWDQSMHHVTHYFILFFWALTVLAETFKNPAKFFFNQ